MALTAAFSLRRIWTLHTNGIGRSANNTSVVTPTARQDKTCQQSYLHEMRWSIRTGVEVAGEQQVLRWYAASVCVKIPDLLHWCALENACDCDKSAEAPPKASPEARDRQKLASQANVVKVVTPHMTILCLLLVVSFNRKRPTLTLVKKRAVIESGWVTKL